MTDITWTPWREHTDLLTVRRYLYIRTGEDGRTLDMRKKGCEIIAAWRLRGALPHAVDSTAALTDAILTDENSNGNISPYALRLCYGTAFCRFVTGLVDSEQTGKVKVTMFTKATEIGIPASFVELRHEITHGELPSLVVMRRAVERSMTWLWDDYWRYQDEASGNLDYDVLALAGSEGTEAFQAGIKEVLQSWRDAEKGESHATNGTRAKPNTIDETTLELTKICHGNKVLLGYLVKILLERGFLVPKGQLTEDQMLTHCADWDPLLKCISVHQRPFLTSLVEGMMSQVVTRLGLNISTNEVHLEAYSRWLEHIMIDKEWVGTRRRSGVDGSIVISTCFQCPGFWAERLLSSLLKHDSFRRFGEIYSKQQSFLEASSTNGLTGEGALQNDQILVTEEPGGWQTMRGAWTPKPIGLV